MKIILYLVLVLYATVNISSDIFSNWKTENYNSDLVSLIDIGYSNNGNHNIHLDLLNYNIGLLKKGLLGITASRFTTNTDILEYSFLSFNNYFKTFAINKSYNEGSTDIEHTLYDFLYLKADLIKFNYLYDTEIHNYFPTLSVGNELAYSYSRFSYSNDNCLISLVLCLDYTIDIIDFNSKFALKLFYRLGGLTALFA